MQLCPSDLELCNVPSICTVASSCQHCPAFVISTSTSAGPRRISSSHESQNEYPCLLLRPDQPRELRNIATHIVWCVWFAPLGNGCMASAPPKVVSSQSKRRGMVQRVAFVIREIEIAWVRGLGEVVAVVSCVKTALLARKLGRWLVQTKQTHRHGASSPSVAATLARVQRCPTLHFKRRAKYLERSIGTRGTLDAFFGSAWN